MRILVFCKLLIKVVPVVIIESEALFIKRRRSLALGAPSEPNAIQRVQPFLSQSIVGLHKFSSVTSTHQLFVLNPLCFYPRSTA